MFKLTASIFCLTLAANISYAQPKDHPSYLIAEYEVLDPQAMYEYGEKTAALIEKAGGKFLARRTEITNIAGDPPRNVAIVEFDSPASVTKYFQSEEHKALAPLREKAATFRTYVVAGGSNYSSKPTGR